MLSTLVKRNKVNICTLDFYDGDYHTSNFTFLGIMQVREGPCRYLEGNYFRQKHKEDFRVEIDVECWRKPREVSVA